jgi:hypothetical protein
MIVGKTAWWALLRHCRASRALTAVGLSLACAGCGPAGESGEEPSGPGDPAVVRESKQVESALSLLGELVGVDGEPLTVQLSPEGGEVPLPGDALLLVAPGALPEPLSLTVTRSVVALNYLSFYVSGAAAYTLESAADVPRIEPPLQLRVEDPDGLRVAVKAVDGTSWERRQEYDEDSYAVTLDHFSTHEIVYLDMMPSNTSVAAAVGKEELRARVGAANDFIRDHANEWESAFLGIEESGSPEALCRDLRELLDAHAGDWLFAFPEDLVFSPFLSAVSLGKFLFTSSRPSDVDGDERLFWQAIEPSQRSIRERVLAAEAPLTPAQVLEIAVQENQNNVALGVLAAHNFLKEETSIGREMVNANFGNPFDGTLIVSARAREDSVRAADYATHAMENGGEVASHLRAWRQTPRSPMGAYDKMGPLYHTFAAMTAAVYMPHIKGGTIAEYGEALMRASGITGDVADPEKGAADACGADVGRRIADLFQAPAAILEPAPAADVVTASSSLTCGGQQWDGDRCFFLWQTPRYKCTPDEQWPPNYSWQPFMKDSFYSYFTLSYFDYLEAFSGAAQATGDPTFECQDGTMGATLDCLLEHRNASDSDCLGQGRLGSTCSAPYGLANVCGAASLSNQYFAEGTQNFDEVWSFIEAHAATNDSYDAPSDP